MAETVEWLRAISIRTGVGFEGLRVGVVDGSSQEIPESEVEVQRLTLDREGPYIDVKTKQGKAWKSFCDSIRVPASASKDLGVDDFRTVVNRLLKGLAEGGFLGISVPDSRRPLVRVADRMSHRGFEKIDPPRLDLQPDQPLYTWCRHGSLRKNRIRKQRRLYGLMEGSNWRKKLRQEGSTWIACRRKEDGNFTISRPDREDLLSTDGHRLTTTENRQPRPIWALHDVLATTVGSLPLDRDRLVIFVPPDFHRDLYRRDDGKFAGRPRRSYNVGPVKNLRGAIELFEEVIFVTKRPERDPDWSDFLVVRP